MGLWVGGVLKLLQYHAARYLALQLLGASDGSRHAVFATGQFYSCPIGFDEVATLHAHGLWHGEDEVIASHGRHQSQTHTRVAAGGLDDGGTGFEDATLLGVGNHGEGDAVFDAAAGIEILYLGNDGGVKVLGGRILVKFQEGGVADEVGQLFCNFCHSVLLCGWVGSLSPLSRKETRGEAG